ncbi:MAG: non-canonical purine NTP diphosphatase [Bacteroidia bacterium]|nr:non-canonical purine NTP diphosphatase [Bacteroidia bacterium]
MELVFASSNQNKVIEIQKVVGSKIKLLSLNDINCTQEIEETGKTFQENALIKARYVFEKYNKNCFADDSGLEVEALNNEPGVYSARYAGEPKNDANNTQKLLKELASKTNRNACFKTVIALVIDGKEQFFEGIIKGHIALEPTGSGGFGYDPVFIPEGYDRTFAQMTLEEKNTISHRAIATKKLIAYLATIA